MEIKFKGKPFRVGKQSWAIVIPKQFITQGLVSTDEEIELEIQEPPHDSPFVSGSFSENLSSFFGNFENLTESQGLST